ncbi:hypothetical protein EVAR_38568_1 [Eumeta japonica]|uniref:Uncharacterized protein n=1 Tax=Eumeta variegata TaxID=151549 RepID=A0A4C1WW91_EUMVA|nr:hypothetical protein EVAR_38568_1 [Eumeta japonica]
MKGLLIVSCLVYVGCVYALPASSWNVPFGHPGDENRHGDYMSSNNYDSSRPGNPAAAFSSQTYGHEYHPQNYNFDRPAPFKDESVPMMVGPPPYMNKPGGFKYNENYGFFQGHDNNYNSPHSSQQQFNIKKPVIPAQNNFESPFDFGGGLSGHPRSVQYESEEDPGLRGHHDHHHHHHDHKHHKDDHIDFPPFLHNHYYYKYPIIFDNTPFELNNIQDPYNYFSAPKPGSINNNGPKDEMKLEIMPSEENIQQKFYSQGPYFGRSMAFENEGVFNQQDVNNLDIFKYNSILQNPHNTPDKNHDNRPSTPANNDFGHLYSDFNNAFEEGKFVQGQHQKHHHFYKPVFGGSQFGFASFPYNQFYYNNPGVPNLKPVYFHQNNPYMNVFPSNSNLNGPKKDLKSAVTKGENKQEEETLRNVDEQDKLKRGDDRSYHHGHHIHFRPVMTEEGDIKFVPVYFHTQTGYYPPFEYFFEAVPSDEQEAEFVDTNEEQDVVLENNDVEEFNEDAVVENVEVLNAEQDDSVAQDEAKS